MNISQKRARMGVMVLLGLGLLYKILIHRNEDYFWFLYCLPSFVLILSVGFDLWTKKIPNHFILALAAISIVFIWPTYGMEKIPFALLHCLLVILFLLPVYVLRIVGGGDVKLVAVLSLILPLNTLFNTVIAGFVFGGLLGLVKVIVDGKLYTLLWNLKSILKFKTSGTMDLTTFPFSVGLLLGWLAGMDM